MKTFSQAAFLAAAGRAADLPPQGPPEVAFAGRSNVGKSSAINAVPRQGAPRLYQQDARSHATPSTSTSSAKQPGWSISPGYGYAARAAAPARAVGKVSLGAYLRARSAPRRRRGGDGCAPPADAAYDLQLIEWLGMSGCLRCFPRPTSCSRAEQASTPVEGRFSDNRPEYGSFRKRLARQGVRRMSRPACRMAASRPPEIKTPGKGDHETGAKRLNLGN